ncbi:PREDICTED: regulator of G-protein signaling 9 isoform X2 [Vollenhovia emeryi]|uniref:regulator of G-protein signaling 9 isoform X2 n=1 Tax=Vollenhovia emeryi TaxID=411798 RepID=UPI0005F4C956|nr:PREDICTED: regulator of G-protein signaling 9 isoform X2 [Vollenhovia emeryi]
MEASSNQQQKEKEPRVHRPYAFDKMEGLVREMQDPESGVPVRSQKQFLTSIPSAFMGECHRYLRCGVSVSGHHGQDTTVGCLRVAGYDLIEWLMERLAIEESVEAVHIANQLCQYGYFFPVNDSKTLTVKDDSSLYRFQTPYYWPWQHKTPDNVDYAIYLAKRTLRNKQRHALEEYEIEALNSLRKNLQNKWDIIQLQAEEQAQVRLSKERKKGDKIVSDSQERAFWRVYRPPPGCLSSLEVVPVPTFRPGLPRPPSRKRTPTDLQREVALLRNSLTRTRIKVSTAIENFKSYFETYVEYDPMFVQPQPSNPWITDDHTFWQLNSPLVEVPTEKRVKRWALSMEELMSDPTGLQEFTNYLRKEYSHENIRFWLAVKDLRHSFQAQIPDKVNEIFREFLAPGAPCEINIDGKTMEKVHQEMKNPSRFTFDSAAEHVYTLLLKKDCYPRFIRSDQYRNLLAAGVQPLQKKRFFVFGGQAKKKVSSTSTPTSSTLQHSNISSGGRRRGSDRSLSGSAHELAVCGVRDVTSAPRVPHSHSQSNLTDIPYRGDLPRLVKIPSRPSPRSIQDAGATEAAARPMDDVCPWEAVPGPSTDPGGPGDAASSGRTASADQARHVWDSGGYATTAHSAEAARASRKNSAQLDSCSSSSDVSLAIADVSERLRKSCSLQHSGSVGTSTSGPGTITRNYSTCSASGRIRLAEIGRASVSSCNYPSPQQSFEYSHAVVEKVEEMSSLEKIVPEEETVAEVVVVKESQPSPKTSAKAPLISISAIVGDLPSDNSTMENADEEASESCTAKDVGEIVAEEKTRGEDSRADTGADVSPVAEEPATTEELPEEAQVVPVWEPNAQQEDRPAAAQAVPREKRDNNVNEVCPWEDEENCRVDAPYVKTYATLGYL